MVLLVSVLSGQHILRDKEAASLKATLTVMNLALCGLWSDAEVSGGNHARLTVLYRPRVTIAAQTWRTSRCYGQQGRYHREAAVTTLERNEICRVCIRLN